MSSNIYACSYNSTRIKGKTENKKKKKEKRLWFMEVGL